MFVVGEITLNTETYEVFKKGTKIELTPKEFKILLLLMRNPGNVYTKKQIYESVWGEIYLEDSNNVSVHISHIRSKIKDNSKTPQYLKTVRGTGYMIDA